MKIAIGIFLIVHGIAHLVGFVVPWKLAELKEAPYKTTLLGGRIDVGDYGIRFIGLLWLFLALSFLGVGLASMFNIGGWIIVTHYLALASLGLSIMGWPEAKIGVPVNIFIVLGLGLAVKFSWLYFV